MPNTISPEQLGFDDSTLSFLEVDGIKPEQLSDHANSGDDSSDGFFGTTSGWDFQTLPAFDDFGIDPTVVTSSGVDDSIMSASWQFPAFPELSGMASSDANDTPPGTAGTHQPTRLSNVDKISATAVLTAEAQEKLRNIAMPHGLRPHQHNVSLSPKSAGQASSPDSADGTQKAARKRKMSSDPDDDDDLEDDDKPVKKTAHNMIEKRYRNNINDKIAALRDSVPSLRIMSKSAKGEDTSLDREELHGLTPAHKLNKATVLSKATEYIQHLEKRNGRLQDENGAMMARIAAFEKLFMAGAMNGSISSVPQNQVRMQYGSDRGQPIMRSPVSEDNSEPPTGMIPVPEDMRRIIAAQMAVGQPYPVPQQPFRGDATEAAQQQSQQQVQQQQQIQQQRVHQHQGLWANTAPYFGKLMVGSLAGLMIMEAARENEQSNERLEGRGLFALPIQLVRSTITVLEANPATLHTLPSLKLLLCLGVFLWVFIPSLFGAKKPHNHKCSENLTAASSPASSIDVRRQAWLTSIQTVWVPRHNFFLEATALVLKTIKLSIRNLLGFSGYQALTGFTEEQEKARVKAWTIALDSQLAGGDVEICKSRLVLTLLASGTLPPTPMRLMLKALHIRVLLWEIVRSPAQLGIADMIAGKLARTQWNAARQLNQALIDCRDDPMIPHEDELPEHLAVLVELECDDVLTRAVVQRAHNLAFNMPTNDLIESDIDGMDDIVDDVYISSPMDAVSAWWATEVLHNILVEVVEGQVVSPGSIDNELELTIRATPSGSLAMLRACLARSIILEKNRGANIATALQALGTERIDSPFCESKLIIGKSAHKSNKGVLLALQCAITIAHLPKSGKAVQLQDAKFQIIRKSLVEPQVRKAMTLLGFTAVMKLMEVATAQLRNIPSQDSGSTAMTIDAMSSSLRNWIGGRAGSKCGIDDNGREKVIARCLGISKELMGRDRHTTVGARDEGICM